MKEDTYLKDNIKKCVDYVMSKNDDDKRRIITGMFQYNDYLINEQLLVKALNDKEKQEWFNNDMFDTYKLEIERLNNELKSLQDSYDIEEEQANYHIDLTDDLREEVDRLNNIINEALEINKDIQEHLDKEFWIGRLELQEQILEGDKE